MWARTELKQNAKMAFKRNYWTCVAVSAIVAVLTGGLAGNGITTSVRNVNDVDSEMFQFFLSPIVLIIVFVILMASYLFTFFVGNVVRVGSNRFYIENRVHQTKASKIFYAFKNGNYGNVVLVMFLREIYTLLWTLLLVIPGIVKAYSYLMIPYLLAENPQMEHSRAFEISKQMMYGHKMEAFILELSFLGWNILSVFTCGIVGIFYVSPYMDATFAEFYTAIRAEAIRKGIVGEQELQEF